MYIEVWYLPVPAPTRHLGANKGYALKHIYFIIKKHTFLSTTKCRVFAVELRESMVPYGVWYQTYLRVKGPASRGM